MFNHYLIRWHLFWVSQVVFIKMNLEGLSNNNRYYLIARDLSYTDYIKIKGFPLFKLGAYKEGLLSNKKRLEHQSVK
jgi:hypothetical protein